MGKCECFFSGRQLSRFSPQVAQFTRSWSSGKMFAFQPRGFVFEPARMRKFFLQVFRSRRFSLFSALWDSPFSALRDFFLKFFKCPTGGSSLQLVWYFATERMLEKPKWSVFLIFRHYETVKISHFSKIFRTTPNGPLQFFWNFATEWMLKNLNEPPFYSFRHCEIFKRNNFCLRIRFSQAQHAISDFKKSFVFLKTFRSMRLSFYEKFRSMRLF